MKTQVQIMGMVILLLFIFPSPASSQIYQWKDQDGNIRFSDSTPPGGVDAKKKIMEDGSIPKIEKSRSESPRAKEGASKSQGQRMEGKRPYRNVQVIMYMVDWCGYCRKARNYLQSLGVDLTEYNVEKDKEKDEERRRRTGGQSGVPVIDVEGTIIIGYRPDRIKEAVEIRRNL